MQNGQDGKMYLTVRNGEKCAVVDETSHSIYYIGDTYRLVEHIAYKEHISYDIGWKEGGHYMRWLHSMKDSSEYPIEMRNDLEYIFMNYRSIEIDDIVKVYNKYFTCKDLIRGSFASFDNSIKNEVI